MHVAAAISMAKNIPVITVGGNSRIKSLRSREVSAHWSLAEVARAAPAGVVCLLSALRFHGLTTQAPPEVWLALRNHAWKPRATPFPVRTVYFSGAALQVSQ